jgi:hypothetical protein
MSAKQKWIIGSALLLGLTVLPAKAHAWSNWSVGVRIGVPCGPCWGGCYRPWGWGCGAYYYPGYPYYVAPPPVYVAPAPAVVVQQAPPPPPVMQQSGAPPAEEVAPPPRPVPSTSMAPPPPPAPVAIQPASATVPARAANNPARQQDITHYVNQLADANDGTRLDSVMQLGRMHAYRAIDPLAATLAGDRSPAVREAAAKALGMIGSPKGLPALQRAAQIDGDHDVRKSAQFAIEIIQSRY